METIIHFAFAAMALLGFLRLGLEFRSGKFPSEEMAFWRFVRLITNYRSFFTFFFIGVVTYYMQKQWYGSATLSGLSLFPFFISRKTRNRMGEPWNEIIKIEILPWLILLIVVIFSHL